MGYLAISVKLAPGILMVAGLCACSSSNIHRTVYDALIQRECIQQTGEPNCDSGQPGYDDYKIANVKHL